LHDHFVDLFSISPGSGWAVKAADLEMTGRPLKWIKPQLTRLVDEAPAGGDWLHEIKYDGYRMHARIDGGQIKLLTRTGLDWSHRYRRTIEALGGLRVKSAYLDGELCALNSDGAPVFSRLQAAMDEGRTDRLVFFAFDLLFLNGEGTAGLPLLERKAGLQRLFRKEIDGLRYSEHVAGRGPEFRAQACKLGLEGAVSKRADQPYAPGDRRIWVKSKCLNREEFVVVGWTDPEGSRSHIGALLLGYYTDDGLLHYAGRAGTGINDKELKRLAGVLKPLAVPKMPLAEPPPRDSRFGSPLKLSRVHWVRPELVVEVTYLTWIEDNLLRQVSYQGQREDKPAKQVVRRTPHQP
jgi:bifunctional non-homologous end joining protein LigD